MALETCSHCGSKILFGAVYVDRKPYCPGCNVRAENLKNVGKARASYQYALSQLKAAPTDPALREKALGVGRLYASWTRHASGQSGVTLFDEFALANDIQAACAAAGAAPSASPAAASVEDRLRRLADLHSKNLISDDEFAQSRAKILADL